LKKLCVKIEADDYEKFLTRIKRGNFGGDQFDPKALQEAIGGERPGFFEQKFKQLKDKRDRVRKDKKAVTKLLKNKRK